MIGHLIVLRVIPWLSIQHEGKSGWFMYGLTPIPKARSSSFSIGFFL